ncbi:ABC transporter ATP-binding protein [Polaribacter sp. Q13]|uniref:ABC transporter ATP-binding protein n=1 Tax=Polaribacter sp. Q13 TaxID=2806551 RepID=UPI00193B6391|nr:ABC transporter ATP-binding protein [Polaribacter sp. Q13]QVY65785.1 ATP-binding cassette domain-containing protein [Polaribacter sp. Q13]
MKSNEVILKVENLSKQYRLGVVGTGTISHDLNRWWHKIRGKEDPFLKIGESNNRATKAKSDYVWSLKDINFEVKKGDILGIIGKNGAGKSTLLKILSKVTGPTTGVIKSNGRIASLLEVGTGFHPEMTGKENVFLNGAILGMTKKEIALKLDEIIEFSGCERYVDTPVKRYSSGMKVRLAFAVAAFLEPDILIVDEVLAVGDDEFQKKAIGKMQDISSQGGRTVLFVSHDMAAIKNLCTRTILLENGEISFDGSVKDALKKYLALNKESIINESLGIYNLRKHIDKKDEFGILEAKLFCDGKLTDTIYSGAKFELEITYKAARVFLGGELGIGIQDNLHNSFLRLNNKHLGKSISIKEGDGKGRIVIEDFPIYIDDTFSINLYFGDSKAYEILENAINFNVKTRDVYESSRLLELTQNKIYHKKIDINTFD